MEAKVYHIVVQHPAQHIQRFWDYIRMDGAYHDIVICEHQADNEIAHTHVHMAIRTTVSQQTLRNKTKEYIMDLRRGNHAIMTKTQKTRLEYDWAKTCIYIIKGNRDHIKYTSLDETSIHQYIDSWIPPTVATSTMEPSAPKDPNTHWDLMQKIIKDTKSMGLWGEVLEQDGLGNMIYQPGLPTEASRMKVYDYMVQVLNENKVRTSRNELERFFMTIIRHDTIGNKLVRAGIFKNLFRE